MGNETNEEEKTSEQAIIKLVPKVWNDSCLEKRVVKLRQGTSDACLLRSHRKYMQYLTVVSTQMVTRN